MSEKKDLTRIQDLSEFTHEDDQEAEKLLRVNFDDDEDQVEESDFLSPSELDDEAPTFSLPETPVEADESEDSFSIEESSFEMSDSELPDVPSDEEAPAFGGIEESVFESEENYGDFESTQDFSDENDFSDNEEENSYDSEQSYSEDDNTLENDHEEYQELSEEEGVEDPVADEVDAPQESEILETYIADTQEQKAQQSVEQDLEKAQQETPIKESTSFASELKKFSEGYSYNMVQSPGAPPYTLIANQVPRKSHEDVLRYIREYKIAGDKEIYQQSLQNDQILISHIGEYVAILMANKLTRLGATVQIAPSDVIHTSVHYEAQESYGSSKDSLDYEVEEDVDLSDHISATNILLSTTPYLQGFKIHKYLGVVQDFVILKTAELKEIINQKEASDHEIHDILDQEYFNSKLIIHEFHDSLRNSLEFQAKKKKGNAIVGLQYSYLRPDRNTFEITCIGTAVYAVKLKEDDLL